MSIQMIWLASIYRLHGYLFLGVGPLQLGGILVQATIIECVCLFPIIIIMMLMLMLIPNHYYHAKDHPGKQCYHKPSGFH